MPLENGPPSCRFLFPSTTHTKSMLTKVLVSGSAKKHGVVNHGVIKYGIVTVSFLHFMILQGMKIGTQTQSLCLRRVRARARAKVKVEVEVMLGLSFRL